MFSRDAEMAAEFGAGHAVRHCAGREGTHSCWDAGMLVGAGESAGPHRQCVVLARFVQVCYGKEFEVEALLDRTYP